eukprot:8363243-Ditylum_brightwellii.AAC.1
MPASMAQRVNADKGLLRRIVKKPIIRSRSRVDLPNSSRNESGSSLDNLASTISRFRAKRDHLPNVEPASASVRSKHSPNIESASISVRSKTSRTSSRSSNNDDVSKSSGNSKQLPTDHISAQPVRSKPAIDRMKHHGEDQYYKDYHHHDEAREEVEDYDREEYHDREECHDREEYHDQEEYHDHEEEQSVDPTVRSMSHTWRQRYQAGIMAEEQDLSVIASGSMGSTIATERTEEYVKKKRAKWTTQRDQFAMNMMASDMVIDERDEVILEGALQNLQQNQNNFEMYEDLLNLLFQVNAEIENGLIDEEEVERLFGQSLPELIEQAQRDIEND